jgi:hypothetical protein
MLDLPLAHAGHVVAVVPFFAPPLLLTLGLAVLAIRDRVRRRGVRVEDHTSITSEDSR